MLDVSVFYRDSLSAVYGNQFLVFLQFSFQTLSTDFFEETIDTLSGLTYKKCRCLYLNVVDLYKSTFYEYHLDILWDLSEL